MFSFKGRITVTLDAQKYLGSWLGEEESASVCMEMKVSERMDNISLLAEIARSQPHAAHSALTHGIMSQWLYFMRTSPCITHLLQPLENTIRSKLIPSILGREVNDFEHHLLALPVRHGGLGISIPTEIAHEQFEASQEITKPLVNATISHDYHATDISRLQSQAKQSVRRKRICKMKTATDDVKVPALPFRNVV